MQNPFEAKMPAERPKPGPIPEKFAKIWKYFEVEQDGAYCGVEDVTSFLAFGKPYTLKRFFADFSREEIEELLDLLQARQRADETRYADSTRPWDLHLQRIYFSVMPINDGPRYDQALTDMARSRVGIFLDAVRRLSLGQEVGNAELFPFDKKYFEERHFPPEELKRLLGMFKADMESMSVAEDVNQRPHLGFILRSYRAIASVNDTTYRHHDDPGLMAVSVYRSRVNSFNNVIGQLERLSAGGQIPGISKDRIYPGYEKEDFERLIAMLENERILLLDMSKKVPIPEGVSNDLWDVEDGPRRLD